jgi:hypothetical protein
LQVFTSDVTPLILVGIGVFIIALFLHFQRSTYYAVRLRDINSLEQDEMNSASALAGKRTTQAALLLIPRILGAALSTFLAFVGAYFLIGLAVLSIWYPGVTSLFPISVYATALVFAVVFSFLTFALVRGLWREYKSRRTTHHD